MDITKLSHAQMSSAAFQLEISWEEMDAEVKRRESAASPLTHLSEVVRQGGEPTRVVVNHPIQSRAADADLQAWGKRLSRATNKLGGDDPLTKEELDDLLGEPPPGLPPAPVVSAQAFCQLVRDLLPIGVEARVEPITPGWCVGLFMDDGGQQGRRLIDLRSPDLMGDVLGLISELRGASARKVWPSECPPPIFRGEQEVDPAPVVSMTAFTDFVRDRVPSHVGVAVFPDGPDTHVTLLGGAWREVSHTFALPSPIGEVAKKIDAMVAEVDANTARRGVPDASMTVAHEGGEPPTDMPWEAVGDPRPRHHRGAQWAPVRFGPHPNRGAFFSEAHLAKLRATEDPYTAAEIRAASAASRNVLAQITTPQEECAKWARHVPMSAGYTSPRSETDFCAELIRDLRDPDLAAALRSDCFMARPLPSPPRTPREIAAAWHGEILRKVFAKPVLENVATSPETTQESNTRPVGAWRDRGPNVKDL